MEFFEGLIKTYQNKAYPGDLLTTEIKESAGFYAGSNPNPFAKDKSSPGKAGKVRAQPPPVESEASGASGASEAESCDEQPAVPDRGRTTAKAGSGNQPRGPSPHHQYDKPCSHGDECPFLKKAGRCKYKHTAEQLKAAEAAKGKDGGAKSRFKKAFMAMPSARTPTSCASSARSRMRARSGSRPWSSWPSGSSTGPTAPG